VSGRLVDQLGLVAALYLYFNFSRQKSWTEVGYPGRFWFCRCRCSRCVDAVDVRWLDLWYERRQSGGVPVVSSTAKPETPDGTALARQQWECVRQHHTLKTTDGESTYGSTAHRSPSVKTSCKLVDRRRNGGRLAW